MRQNYFLQVLRSPIIRGLVYSQLSLFYFLAFCIVLIPAGLGANSGISYYGTRAQTLIPYNGALLLSGFWLLVVALRLAKAEPALRPLAATLIVIVALLGGVILTPFSLSPFFGAWHELFGAFLFLIELAVATWLTVLVQKDWRNLVLVTIQFLSGVICLFSLYDWLPWEIQGQIVFQLTFGLVLIRALSWRLASRSN